MSNDLVLEKTSSVPSLSDKVYSVIVKGDFSLLSPAEEAQFFKDMCSSLGLNPMTGPFQAITLQGKKVLYAKKDCTDQLRRIYDISIRIVSREVIDGVYVVTAQASQPSGRVDESIGAVPIGGLKGDALANGMMKAETKAKRRATLSICGLGMLDESEHDTIAELKNREAQEHQVLLEEIVSMYRKLSKNYEDKPKLAQLKSTYGSSEYIKAMTLDGKNKLLDTLRTLDVENYDLEEEGEIANGNPEN